MREQPKHLVEKMDSVVREKNDIVISAITYQEMKFGLLGKKASLKHKVLVDEFLKRVNSVLPWDMAAVDETISVKRVLMQRGMPIGDMDCAIAGHAISKGCILVTNNTREFFRVECLRIEDWSIAQ